MRAKGCSLTLEATFCNPPLEPPGLTVPIPCFPSLSGTPQPRPGNTPAGRGERLFSRKADIHLSKIPPPWRTLGFLRWLPFPFRRPRLPWSYLYRCMHPPSITFFTAMSFFLGLPKSAKPPVFRIALPTPTRPIGSPLSTAPLQTVLARVPLLGCGFPVLRPGPISTLPLYGLWPMTLPYGYASPIGYPVQGRSVGRVPV